MGSDILGGKNVNIKCQHWGKNADLLEKLLVFWRKKPECWYSMTWNMPYGHFFLNIGIFLEKSAFFLKFKYLILAFFPPKMLWPQIFSCLINIKILENSICSLYQRFFLIILSWFFIIFVIWRFAELQFIALTFDKIYDLSNWILVDSLPKLKSVNYYSLDSW